MVSVLCALWMMIIMLSLYVIKVDGIDCCSAEYSYSGIGCTVRGTDYLGTTTYCVPRDAGCTTCYVATDVDESECTSCCSPTATVCQDNLGRDISYSGWALVCVVFAGSCCCCCVVFISSESSRSNEGFTFEQAYLLPIPIVAADLDFDDKDFDLPPDQPTAIAKAHNNLDIPVAEPAEFHPFHSFYSERQYFWE